MGTISLSIPQTGQPNSTQDPLVASDFATLLAWANGGIDGDNLSPTGAQSAGMNQSGQTVKGAVNIPTSESTPSTTYTTLATPDRVTGVVLPTNGLIAVWYQATWSASAGSGNGRAAIFLGANQVKVVSGTGPVAQEASSSVSAGTANDTLATAWSGLQPGGVSGGYTGDVTTGQVVAASTAVGGPCCIFAAAGTYTVSVQFKAPSGSVTASNRKLWVQAISF